MRGASAALTVDLSASPQRLPSDGNSTAVITAEVRDSGNLVRDGIEVLFTTSDGSLGEFGGATPTARQVRAPVQGGYARCVLRATQYDAVAQISAAVIGQGVARADRLEVPIGAADGPDRQTDHLIRVRGEFLRYLPESQYQVMEVVGNAICSYQGVEIRSGRLQIDLQEYIVLAKDYSGGVTVATGPPPYEERALDDGSAPPYQGEALAMDLRAMVGLMYSVQRGEVVHFNGRNLRRMQDVEPAPGTFDLFDLRDAKIEITARRATIYPYDRIRFDNVKFFVEGLKVLSLPYYFEGLGYRATAGPALTQMVSYSTQDGLILDIPYYFDVGDYYTNEFRLTRGVQSGVFGRNTGLQLSYRHHADLGPSAGEWDFVVDEIGHTFGVRYQRAQRFSPYTFGTMSLAWPQHRNFFSNATLYTPAGPGNVSLTANVDFLSGETGGLSANTNAAWQANPVRLEWLDSSLSASLGVGYSRNLSGREFYRQSMSVSLTKRPWQLGLGGSLQPYAGLRFQNTVNGSQEAAFTANLSYRQALGPWMSMSFGYTYDTQWSSKFSIPDRHLLTANWQLYRDRIWTGYAFANYDLMDGAFSASALLDYGFAKHWGAEVQTIYQTSQAGAFSDTEFWLYRVLGARELRLRYSLEQGRLFFEIDNRY